LFRSTIKFLRHNEHLSKLLDCSEEADEPAIGLDLIRCESLKELDSATMGRLLDKVVNLPKSTTVYYPVDKHTF